MKEKTKDRWGLFFLILTIAFVLFVGIGIRLIHPVDGLVSGTGCEPRCDLEPMWISVLGMMIMMIATHWLYVNADDDL